MDKPNCFNRPDYTNSHQAQDGWNNITVGGRKVRVPRMVKIKNVMSKECQQNKPLGAAVIYEWDCKGCKHYAKS